MCGVVARIGGALRGPIRGWDSAMARLRRRGPDGEGSWASDCGRARLGHTRLAINDLTAAAAQPMVWREPGREDAPPVALAFNGEVYNAPTLRRELEALGHRFASTGDTEVILRGHIAWGFGRMLERLGGMFSIVVWPNGVLTRAKQGFSLRLGDDPWTAMMPRLHMSALVRDGVLADRWEGFIAPDAAYRSAKIQMLCTIAAWYEARRGGAIP